MRGMAVPAFLALSRFRTAASAAELSRPAGKPAGAARGAVATASPRAVASSLSTVRWTTMWHLTPTTYHLPRPRRPRAAGAQSSAAGGRCREGKTARGMAVPALLALLRFRAAASAAELSRPAGKPAGAAQGAAATASPRAVAASISSGRWTTTATTTVDEFGLPLVSRVSLSAPIKGVKPEIGVS